MLAEVTIKVAVPVRVIGPTDVILTSSEDVAVPVTLPNPIHSVVDPFANGAEGEVERIAPVLRGLKLVLLIVLVATEII